MTTKKRNWLIIGGILIVLIAAGIYSALNRQAKIEYTTADVTKGTLVQTVNETGTITPAKEIELNFPNTGQLSSINVKVGDQVIPEQPLGQIDSSSLAIKAQEASANLSITLANVSQAQGNYQSAQREYQKLKSSLEEAVSQAQKTQRDLEDRGTGTVTTYEQAISTAESNLVSTKSTYQRGIENKQAALGTAFDNKISNATTSLDDINRILLDEDARPTLGVQNSGALSIAKANYSQSREAISQAKAQINLYKGNNNFLEAAYSSSENALNKVFETLNNMFTVLSNSVTSPNFTQTELDAYKNNIDSQITVIASAVSALQTAKQTLDDARLSYDTNVLAAQQNISQAQANYDAALRTARNAVASSITSRDQQLASAQTRVDSTQANLGVVSAQVSQAQASVDFARNQLQDTVLKSPIKGVITKINYQVGEQVSPQKAFLSVLTENNFQLEIDIAETDIIKIKQNNQATITLDSFGEDNKFMGTVYFIEPAATVIQGVTYYKVKISFDPGDKPVKPGMTASAVITTARLENVLMMPSRAVIEKDGNKIVRLMENDVPREVTITTGLNGDDGMIQVLSGLSEGDKVVTFVKDGSKK